ncbi:FecR family protein [Bowmanella denitrificans]|uniref:FecR family protein n=1 Tax=Bowmanella denitrificans TaxID=366582 RepID=A0ABN0WST6_9ALTE
MSNSRIDPNSLQSAASWFVEMQEQTPTTASRIKFEAWLESPANRHAWQKVLEMHSTFEQFSRHQQQHPSLHELLQQPVMSRRAVIKCLALFGVSFMTYLSARTPIARSTWYQMAADHSVPVGQSEHIQLAEHLQLWLNTNTAIDTRQIGAIHEITLLQGELFVEHNGLGQSKALRINTNWQAQEFVIESSFSHLNLYKQDAGCELCIFQGQAILHGAGESKTLQAGQQISWTAGGFSALGTVTDLPGWRDGKLIAKDMSLQAFGIELNRYRQGFIRVAPEVQNLSIDGVFPAFDSDKTLEMLALSLPISVSKVGPWWVNIASA